MDLPDPTQEGEPVSIPITGELDLHTFRPNEISRLLPDYFEACVEQGIRQVRVIHGKGTGTLRETVHAILRKNPAVKSYRLGLEHEGSWGATVVELL